MEELIILGSGPAGWTAAIYAGRANLNPIVITGREQGGQLTLTTVVENFPGFPEGVDGPKLMVDMQKQAEKFGARTVMEKATGFKPIEGGYEITCTKETYQTKSVIIATGASARWLGNEGNFKGQGVHTCATCDGFFYKDKEIIVVGGGDSAMEEATFLTKFASKVTMLNRTEDFKASKIMLKKAQDNPKIEILLNKEIKSFNGDKKLESVTIHDNKTNEDSDMEIAGVFLAIGHIPNTDFVEGVLDLDDYGYLEIDENLRTKLPGVFGAGDVHDKLYRQAITAAGKGCQAALEAERYLEEQ